MPSRGVSHFMLKGSLTSFEGSLVLRPRGEYSSAPHVGRAHARSPLALDSPSFKGQLWGRIECVRLPLVVGLSYHGSRNLPT